MNWIDSLVAYVHTALENGKRVVVIGVARKMARLLNVYVNKSAELRSVLGKKDVSLITEHAIPFVLSGSTSDDTEVIIVDDLIVYGDTVETISENVFILTGIISKIVAMAVAESALLQFRYGEIIYPEDNNIPNFLSQEDIPQFTAINSREILSSHGPVDLEHTIVKIKNKIDDTERFQEHLESALKQAYPEAIVYSVVHLLPYLEGEMARSVSLCFPASDDKCINNDFNKLRFFISSDGVKIVSFAPNIWDETLLDCDFTLFNTISLKDVWDHIRDYLRQVSTLKDVEKDSILQDTLIREFNTRIELSAVVTANYLISFDQFMIRKNEILQLLEEIYKDISPVNAIDLKVEIDKEDLGLLLGKEMASLVFPSLGGVFENIETEKWLRYSLGEEEGKNIRLIPEKNQDEYKKKKFQFSYLAPTLEAALSLIFYSLWKDYGLINNRDKREDRVHIGETFYSLAEDFKAFYKEEDIKMGINRWIDRGIDLGFVVPKYEASLNRLGYREWRRYFRPGEREDPMVSTAREAVIISRRIFNDRSFSFGEFKERIIPELKKRTNESDGQICYSEFGQGVFRTSMKNNPTYFLWIYLNLIGSFRLVDDSNWNESIINFSETAPLFSRSAIYETRK